MINLPGISLRLGLSNTFDRVRKYFLIHPSHTKTVQPLGRTVITLSTFFL